MTEVHWFEQQINGLVSNWRGLHHERIKTLENQNFSEVSRGEKKGTMATFRPKLHFSIVEKNIDNRNFAEEV